MNDRKPWTAPPPEAERVPAPTPAFMSSPAPTAPVKPVPVNPGETETETFRTAGMTTRTVTTTTDDPPEYYHDGKFDAIEDILQKEVSFFRSLMSVDEAKTSVLMLCLMISLIFGGVAYTMYGDLSDNWTTLIETFTYCVTGINVVNAFNAKGGTASSVFGKLTGGNQQTTTTTTTTANAAESRFNRQPAK